MGNETKVCLKRYSRFWHTFFYVTQNFIVLVTQNFIVF